MTTKNPTTEDIDKTIEEAMKEEDNQDMVKHPNPHDEPYDIPTPRKFKPPVSVDDVTQGVAGAAMVIRSLNRKQNGKQKIQDELNPLNLDMRQLLQDVRSGEMNFAEIVGNFTMGVTGASMMQSLTDWADMLISLYREDINSMLGFELIPAGFSIAKIPELLKSKLGHLYNTQRGAVLVGGGVLVAASVVWLLRETDLIDKVLSLFNKKKGSKANITSPTELFEALDGVDMSTIGRKISQGRAKPKDVQRFLRTGAHRGLVLGRDIDRETAQDFANSGLVDQARTDDERVFITRDLLT